MATRSLTSEPRGLLPPPPTIGEMASGPLLSPGRGQGKQPFEPKHFDELLLLLGPANQDVGTLAIRIAAIIIDRLERLEAATLEPPRRFRGKEEVMIRTVSVASSAEGSITKGPNIKIPVGYACTVRQRHHAGDPVGYVAMSEQAVQRSGERIELVDGENVSFKIDNMDALVFWSGSGSEVIFELIAEA